MCHADRAAVHTMNHSLGSIVRTNKRPPKSFMNPQSLGLDMSWHDKRQDYRITATCETKFRPLLASALDPPWHMDNPPLSESQIRLLLKRVQPKVKDAISAVYHRFILWHSYHSVRALNGWVLCGILVVLYIRYPTMDPPRDTPPLGFTRHPISPDHCFLIGLHSWLYL